MNAEKALLLEEIKNYIQELRFLRPEKETLEWYLINNLSQYLAMVERTDEPIEIHNATSIFSRFCTESMDWDTSIYKKCMGITKIGFQLGKG